MNKNTIRLIVITAFLIMILFFSTQDFFTLDKLKAQQDAIQAYRNLHPALTLLLYGLIYIVVAGLSLPGATILTLAGGGLFSLFWGTVIVSFASTIGAVLAFLAARFLFRESLEQRFSRLLTTVNKGMAEEGAYYLFTLRLIPLIPFFAVNLVMGLTHLKTATYFWVSQIGMLPGTLLYVNAGTQLASIKTLSDIGSPILIASFALIGIFPLVTKKIMEHIKSGHSAS